jgi:hypothetical protein
VTEHRSGAYDRLQHWDDYKDLSDRSRLIVTYALCGFANIGWGTYSNQLKTNQLANLEEVTVTGDTEQEGNRVAATERICCL